MSRSLCDLPKAHLHLHLEGCARPETLHELAGDDGQLLERMQGCRDLSGMLEVYWLVISDVITTPKALARICCELVEDQAAQGVVYCEPMVVPHLYPNLGTTDEVLDVMRDAFGAASRRTGVGVGLMIGIDRAAPVADAEATARFAAAHAGLVVSLGLAGDELAAPAGAFDVAAGIAREAGLLFVPHAGETAGPQSVWDALSARPRRIAHGVRAAEDPSLLQRLRELELACDVCPTSNVRLGVCERLEAHPLPVMVQAGVTVTLNADDSAFFGASIVDEYVTARTVFGLSDDVLAGIARSSLTASGAPRHLVAPACRRIDDWLAT